MQDAKYRPLSRTSYIGRETDNESDLGFGACPEALRGRVSMYEPLYGRFLSTDPLWGKSSQLVRPSATPTPTQTQTVNFQMAES
jgi:hypothetical protein